jgi:transcription elongation GreA/GreB family factor
MDTLEVTNPMVTIGSTVSVRDLDSRDVEVYTLVPPGQADIAANRISSMTPLAHAIYGARPGDEVEVTAPGGVIRLLIESVRPQPGIDEYG